MKTQLASLEREIAIKIQEKQLKEQEGQNGELPKRAEDTQVVQLQPTPHSASVPTTTAHDTGGTQKMYAQIRKNSRMKF